MRGLVVSWKSVSFGVVGCILAFFGPVFGSHAQSTGALGFTWASGGGGTPTTHYFFSRTPAGSFPASGTDTTSGSLSYTLPAGSLAPGNYFFAVAASNSAGTSAKSTEVGGTASYPLSVSLQSGAVNGKSFTISVYAVGGTSAVATKNTTAAAGTIQLPAALTAGGALPTNFAVKIDAPKFLSFRDSNRTAASTASMLPLLGGDYDNDDTVTDVDYDNIRAAYFTTNANLDLDGDNVVTDIEYDIVRANYFKSGQVR